MLVTADQERLAREHAGLFELQGWTILELTGPDRAVFLHSFCTQDIQNLSAGELREAFVTNVKGRILGHILVLNVGERLLLLTVPDVGPALLRHLSMYLLGRDAEIRDAQSSMAAVLLIGPEAPDLSQKISTPGIFTAACPILSVPAVLVAGEIAPVQQCVAQSAAAGLRRLQPETFDLLRIEAGYPWYGRDISEDHIAQEAARTTSAIHFRKGCYLGQEPIARLDAMGHTNRELRLLSVAGTENIPDKSIVSAGDVEIGQITSVVSSELLNQTLALAVLKVKQSSLGESVNVQTSPARSGTVVEFTGNVQGS